MTRIHNIGHIHNANFVQTQFSTSHPQKQHFLKSWEFTFLWKYSVCGLKFEISEYRERKEKQGQSILLSFHEFLSDWLHIYRVNRLWYQLLLGTQKFRILTRKRNIFTKRWISVFSKSAIFWGVMSKIEFEQNWRYGYVLYYGIGSK